MNRTKLLRTAVRDNCKVTLVTSDGEIGPAKVANIAGGWVVLQDDTRWWRVQQKAIKAVIYE